MAQRQRVADRARLFDRRDNRHLAGAAQALREHSQPFRAIPIVIRDQDPAHLEIVVQKEVTRALRLATLAQARAGSGGTTTKSSAVAISASAAPRPNAAGAPWALQISPKRTLAASAPSPCTAV